MRLIKIPLLNKISITGKHFLVYLAVCMMVIAAVAIYSFHSARTAILERTFEQLNSVRVEKTSNVERFFRDRARDAEMLASSDIVAELVRNSGAFSENGRYGTMDTLFTKYLSNYLGSGGYYRRFLIVSEQGPLRSLDLKDSPDLMKFRTADSSTLKLVSPLIQRIRKTGSTGISDYLSAGNAKPAMFIAAPLKVPGTATEKGVVVLEIDINAVNDMMYEINPDNGLGESGEAYIVGGDYKIRTASRFKDHSIFNMMVKTEGVQAALAGNTGSGIIRDYRGISVLSSYSRLNIRDLDWVILAEMDTAEAMIPVENLRNDILWLACVITLLMSGVVYLISRSMTLPIIRLRQATKKISAGDYSFHVSVTSQDELGALTEAFNQMADQLEIQATQIREARLKRLSSMIDGQELERQRLSRDLHDSLGQSVLAIKLKLEQARQDDPEKSRRSLVEALGLIQEVIHEIRTISHDLVPPVLTTFGLVKGLNNLCRGALLDNGNPVTFEAAEIPEDLSARTQIYLYRIAQEAVHNVLKHARATSATVELMAEGTELIMQIKDNGCGINQGNAEKRSNGINNMLERAELLGGICTFTSSKGAGTRIEVRVPLKRLADD